jgi:hypothetical protein
MIVSVDISPDPARFDNRVNRRISQDQHRTYTFIVSSTSSSGMEFLLTNQDAKDDPPSPRSSVETIEEIGDENSRNSHDCAASIVNSKQQREQRKYVPEFI